MIWNLINSAVFDQMSKAQVFNTFSFFAAVTHINNNG